MRSTTKVPRYNKPKIPVKKVEPTTSIFVRGVRVDIKKKLDKLAKKRNLTVGKYLNELIKEQE